MYDQNSEAQRLLRPMALSAANLLDGIAMRASSSARSLREAAPAANGGRLAAERPRDRLGPRDRLFSRHRIPDTWRIK